MAQVDSEAALHAFARGEADWHALTDAGIAIESSTAAFKVSSPGSDKVLVTGDDIMAGLRAHRADASALRFWAQSLLGVIEFDFGDLGETAGGHRLLSLLWDAGSGKVPSARDVGRRRGKTSRRVTASACRSGLANVT